MSESERRAPDTGEGELATALGPGDPGQTSDSKISKENRRVYSSSERQIKVERAQKCLENAALVSKRIKEHRRAAAELLGKSFEDEATDAASDLGSVSTRTGYTSYSATTSDAGPPISVEDALNIPGISESLANTLKQKELLMERIKQYKEISKRERPATVKSKKSSALITSAVQEECAATKVGSKHDLTQLQNTVIEKDNTISTMQVKIKAMEHTILDLQEKISEKDSVIEAKNRATTLMSDNLSKKEKDSVSLLEDTRQQMVKMQENFVAMETEWKLEKNRLLSELQSKNEKIKSLEEANAILEDARFEASLTNSKLIEEINVKNELISNLEEKLSEISKEIPKQKEHCEEEKGSQEISNMVEMTKRLELLEQLNCQIKQTNLELENKLSSLSPQGKTVEPTASKKLSPQVTRKRGKSATRNTSAKVKSPWTALAESSQDTGVKTHSKETTKDEAGKIDIIVQSLNKELLEKEYLLSQKDSLLHDQLKIIAQKEEQLNALISSKPTMVDIGIMYETFHTAPETETSSVDASEENPVTPEELLKKLNDAQNQVSALNIELESANKNMIKVKSAHKQKLKQMQKTIDNFTKMSDSNAEVSRLSEEVGFLTQKIAELEEDKGNLQLHLVDYDSGRLTESELSRKLITLESLSEARLKAIADLETQKFDLVQELHILQQKNSEIEDKLTDLQHLYSDHVSTEMKSAQLEEQLDKATAARKELQLVIENLKLDKEHSKQSMKDLQDKNIELSNKLDVYIQENIDLTNRLEKLSAEKVSSAESIEMVEALTAQEKMELEEYNKKIKSPHEKAKAEDAVSPNLEKETNEFSENLIKLSQESEELHKKIELFTQERHEVMEKMTEIKSENEQLHLQLEQVNNIKEGVECQVEAMRSEKENLEKINIELAVQIENLKTEQLEILRENANMIKRPVSEETSNESESPPKENPESLQGESVNLDEKPQLSKTKNPKQMTKEILKLKNVIKEREAEIADCQMKILSLEEQQQKLSDIIVSSERSLKTLTDENVVLREESAVLKLQIENNPSSDLNFAELESIRQTNDELQNVIKKTTTEYLSLISAKDAKINELECLLIDYENKIAMYVNSLQEKDKDLTDYLNQISQLNNVSQKLKSTIELLEEEKLKDQNGELIKNLNLQINNFKALIHEQETKIKIYEEDKHDLLLIKSTLEKNITNLEDEIKKLYNSLVEKDVLIKDLQDFKNNYDKELSKFITECKYKDEEIHEIKLQLRKESIENENLRQSNNEFSSTHKILTAEIQALNKLRVDYEEIARKNGELNDNVSALETKNKELMDKLKKFAANLKKKTNMCGELDNEITVLRVENDKKQEIINAFENKILSLTTEIERLTSQGLSFDQNKMQELEIQVLTLLQEKSGLAEQLKDLEHSYIDAQNDKRSLSTNIELLSNQLQNEQKDVQHLKSKVNDLQKKLKVSEADHTNNINLNNKVSELELNVKQKQDQIVSLLNDIEKIQDEFNTFKFGQEAKIQEKDLFIESLETEISKYRARISRLEESISIMEDRRYSLERKADQLGNQLEEKQKAYRQYSTNEDELVNRLAVLMEHDQIVEKQLKEIEKENFDLQNKIQNLVDDNKHLLNNLLTAQEECVAMKENSNKVHQEELDICNARISQLELQIKNMSIEHQMILKKQQGEIHSLESEFNVQIENSIKDRKSITEKYEKEKENNKHMEKEIHQHVEHIKTLSNNLDELAKINSEIQRKAISDVNTSNNDYTEQYISEINKMQAIIRQNNFEIDALQKYELENKNTIIAFEMQLNESKKIIMNMSREIESLRTELDQSYVDIKNLKIKICTLDSSKASDVISEITSTNIVIPESSKTADSSVLPYDMSLLESQIEVSEVAQLKKALQTRQTNMDGVKEEMLVSKKAYLCYDESVNPAAQVDKKESYSNIETDPFNSEEGWGFGEKSVEYEEENSRANELSKINKLISENEQLKTDIVNINKKFTKALKKLKELKAHNDKLVNDLKANQISLSSTLDNTIEDELKCQVEALEKTVQSISADLVKEKRDKESLCKQNEIFKNANDRFLEMKEKLENDVVMWKYKFKELTDKVSSYDWEEDQKSHHVKPESIKFPSSGIDMNTKDMFEQIEKENDDLNLQVEELKKENLQQSIIQSKQKDEINLLQHELSALKLNLEKCQEELLQRQNEMQCVIDNLHSNSQENELANKIMLEKLTDESNQLNNENLLLKTTIKELNDAIDKLTEECNNLKVINVTINAELSSLKNVNLQNNANALQSELSLTANKSKLLEDEMQKLNVELQNSLSNCKNLSSQLTQSNEKVALLEKKATEFENKFLKLNEENDQLLSTVTELRASITSAVDQRGYEVAEMWKQHLVQRESEFANVDRELRDQILVMEKKYENLLDNVQSSSQEETNKMIVIEQLSSLQAKLKDKEDHLLSLQNQYSNLVSEMQMLRAEIEDEKVICENKLLNQQEEYEKQLKEIRDLHANDNASKDYRITELNKQLERAKEENQKVIAEITEMSKVIEGLKINVTELNDLLISKDKDIFEKTQDLSFVLNERNNEFEVLKHKLIDYEKKIEELSFEKESELAVMRLKMHEQLTDFENNRSKLQSENDELVNSLTDKIQECATLNRQITDLNKSLQEDSIKMNEMKSALESQELEIVTLKDDIERLQILLDSSAAKISKHVTFASGTKPAAAIEGDEDKGSSEPMDLVPRTELDLALYMLYQRDMRCEELTMELSSLLEERDTLQLRLSNALRTYEELRRKEEASDVDVAAEVKEIIEKNLTKETHLTPSTSQVSASNTDTLKTKLTELRSVRQSRDVRLRQDSERRELDMQLLQRDVSRLPPEAADQLRQAHYTLSRDSQSASTVLLNWLMGKNTPKVVHM